MKKAMTEEKKISGVKLHLGVDTNGLPHAMSVTTANVTDRDGAVEMIRNCAPNLSDVAKVLCDGGYTGENFASAVGALIDAEVEVVKRNELHKFVVIPKRWVVERSNAWLEKFRRLWKNCERKLHTSLQMTVLAFISLLLAAYEQVINLSSSSHKLLDRYFLVSPAVDKVFFCIKILWINSSFLLLSQIAKSSAEIISFL